MNFRDKSVMFFATGCFIGNTPFAPGTFGTILGLPLCFLLAETELPVAVFLIVIFIIFAVLIAHNAEKILKKNDPGCIIIDEIAGIVVTFIGLKFNIISALTGFIIFRFFDILKPFPIRFLEEKVPGGAGVVIDDIMAGIYSNLVLRVLLFTVS